MVPVTAPLGAGIFGARRTNAAGPAHDGRPADALTGEDRALTALPSATPLPPTDDRPKVGPNPTATSPPKDDRRKAAPNPLVPLHEAIVAAGPGEVWNRMADSLSPLLQDWQSYAHNQQWDRLAANLAAATTIAAGMSLLWERGQKYYQSDAEPEGR